MSEHPAYMTYMTKMKAPLLSIVFLCLMTMVWGQKPKIIYGDSEPGTVNLKADGVEKAVTELTTPIPQIRWVGSYPANTSEPQIKLSARVTSQSDLYNVYVNVNQTPQLVRLGSEKKNVTVEQMARLKKGKNTFRVTATNAGGNAESRVITVTYTPQDEVYERKDYAILFGTQTYANPKYAQLENATYDVQSVGKELETRFGFDSVVIVMDPNKADLRTTLGRFAQKSFTSYDQLFIFYMGHGDLDPLFENGYFVASDATSLDGCTSHADFLAMVDRINCRHIMVVADACFSGRMANQTYETLGGGDRLYDQKNKDQIEIIKERLDPLRPTRIFIASGSDKVPAGIPGRHTPFTSSLLSAFSKANSDQNFMLDAGELKEWFEGKKNNTVKIRHFGKGNVNATFLLMYQK
ncbi:MAG: caspase family protein [Bacteroidota bacterium]